MKSGNWVPISKALSGTLPKNRSYSKLEAAFSLQLDYDAGKKVTISGYASLWQWSRGKVDRFFREIGLVIQYPESTRRKQNQNGQIMIQETGRSPAKKGPIRLIDSRGLDSAASRSRAESEQKTGRSQSTTIDTNPKTDNVLLTKIIGHLNTKTGKSFKATSCKSKTLIRARVNEGYTLDDFKKVISHKVSTWAADPKMSAYLRPETLFGTKFESYLNENGDGGGPAAPQPAIEVQEIDFTKQFENE